MTDLQWSDWLPLTSYSAVPRVPGVYRVRRTEDRLTYIGQTGRPIPRRLWELARGVHANECPFNDPHAAAPRLWLMRTLEGAEFAVSYAQLIGDKQVRMGTEDMLLWRHRVDTGHSTEANYGRFFPGYSRPSNMKPGRRAAPDPGRDFTASHPALRPTRPRRRLSPALVNTPVTGRQRAYRAAG